MTSGAASRTCFRCSLAREGEVDGRDVSRARRRGDCGRIFWKWAAWRRSFQSGNVLAALVKLGESLDEALPIGSLRGGCAKPVDRPHTEKEPDPISAIWIGIRTWTTSCCGLAPGVLVETDCAVCGVECPQPHFRKAGVQLQPLRQLRACLCEPARGRPGYRAQLGRELDARDFESELLEVQKFYAAPICHVLRTRAPGPRLLDIGFGRGYVLQLARSYGFEVYGIETLAAAVRVALCEIWRPAALGTCGRCRTALDRLRRSGDQPRAGASGAAAGTVGTRISRHESGWRVVCRGAGYRIGTVPGLRKKVGSDFAAGALPIFFGCDSDALARELLCSPIWSGSITSRYGKRSRRVG